jgi:hypothetical protein
LLLEAIKLVSAKRKKNEFLQTARWHYLYHIPQGSWANREGAMFMIYDTDDVDNSTTNNHLSSYLNRA